MAGHQAKPLATAAFKVLIAFALAPGGVTWGRLGSQDHMFSLPITPTAHLGPRAGGLRGDPGGHNSRLSHVSRAEPKGYAARHSLLETQHSVARTSSGNPFAPGATIHAFSHSGRHSTPPSMGPTPNPRHTLGRNGGSNRSSQRGSEAGSGFGDTGTALHGSKSYSRGSTAHVNVEAYSNIGLSEVSSFGGRESSLGGRESSLGGRESSLGGRESSLGGRESSYVSSSSSSQESESHGSVQPPLRVISLDQDSGRIISADSPRGSSRVLAWHPSSMGGSEERHVPAHSDRSATSASESCLPCTLLLLSEDALSSTPQQCLGLCSGCNSAPVCFMCIHHVCYLKSVCLSCIHMLFHMHPCPLSNCCSESATTRGI